jgi:ABC-2 type transport system permease protein
MNKTRIIFRHELTKVLRSRSYQVTLVLLPLVSFIIFFVLGQMQGTSQASVVTSIIAPAPKTQVLGLVDLSGILKTIPPDDTNAFTIFADQNSAQQALQSGQIDAYYLVPADYLQSGDVEYYTQDFNPLSGASQSGTLQYLLEANLLADQPKLLASLQHAFNLNVQVLNPESNRNPESAFTFFLPYIVTFLFYILILGSSSTMLSNISSEKQNRVMEVLLTSIKPLQMMTGKILALGTAGLLQTVVWSGLGLIMLRLSGKTFSLPAEFQLPLSILGWGVVFFLLGYAIFASLLAGVGALVPNLRESSQATLIVVIPMVIPLAFITTLIENPNSAVSLVLSLFPLTSPVAMMTRLSATTVPFWQPLLAVALQALTAVLIIRSVSGMFRAQTLLSGRPFSLKVFIQALAGKFG